MLRKPNQLVRWIEEFTIIFSENPGSTQLVELTIAMNTAKPARVKPYPIPFNEVSDVVKVDRMLKLGAMA